MANTVEKYYSEVLGFYGSALEYTLKVNKTLASGAQKALQEQIAFLDAALAKLAPIASAKQPSEFVAAQSTVAKELQEQVVNTTRKLIEIQTETGNELKELVSEGAEKFSPAAVASLFRKAA